MNVQIIPVTPFQQNCSVIWDDEKNAAIIDPGGDAERIINFINENELKPKMILLTHGHLDHVGGAAKLKREFNLEIIGPHKADHYWLQGLPQQAEQFGLPYCAPLTPDRWLEECETVQFGALSFSVLHLPGHTPGHIGFINQEENIAFTGDVLFRRSIGRTDFPGGDFSQLINSIKTKLWPLADDMQIVPGHGLLTTIADEKRQNPFLNAQNID
ncbi:MBL fold metallo-hydrolase [Gallibacterium salpingitidis]|uniref:Beta-lactamase n=1 Tax=Gallibacterium salpingitidis TaxID=505341 RepID=A0A1A7P1E2_9PAST|nr:MBL fold metallo-hydrolase [Gallibacterium salpingitidis]OBW95650.1 beta-lactamase [Gallibacterium salpingitidis]